MKVYVYIKIKENKNPQGTTKGDIIYVYPMVEDQGKLTLDNFIPVVMDLKIPCGEDFNKQVYDCSKCKENDWETCDVIKYQRAKWTAGDIDNPPKTEKARRYSIDNTKIMNIETEQSKILIEEKV